MARLAQSELLDHRADRDKMACPAAQALLAHRGLEVKPERLVL